MQLVVRVIHKNEASDRGDVVEVVEDDHQWGRLDLTNPSWVVLRVPIGKDEADAMREGDARAFCLDLDALIAKGYAGIPTKAEAEDIRDRYEAQAARGISRSEAKHDPANASWTTVVDVTAADFRAARTLKSAPGDRMVIG